MKTILFGTLLFSNPNWDKVQIETIKLFQEYIQIDTSNPPGDVTKAVQWFAEIFDQENIDYKRSVTGVAYSKDDAKITVTGVEDKPGVAANLFEPLNQHKSQLIFQGRYQRFYS